MTREQVIIGQRVRALIPFMSVPRLTEAVVDELYEGGFMVAWDLPDRPLPKDYKSHSGVPAMRCPYLRDGFALDDRELEMLEVVA